MGQELKWHQDIQFYPHTNYSPLSFGTLLEDVGLEQGPVRVVPGSHRGDVFRHYTDDGIWTACIQDRDLDELGVKEAPQLMGPAGTITVHSCHTIHGSDPNRSDRGRPLLVNTYSAADAFSLHAPAAAQRENRHDHSRQSRSLCPARSSPLPHAARLVGWILGEQRRDRRDQRRRRLDKWCQTPFSGEFSPCFAPSI